jgi:hypothetical protein
MHPRLTSALALACCLLGGPARGAPQVTVKARTLLRVLDVRRAADGVVVAGDLRDRDLLSGIPNRRVWISVEHGGVVWTRWTRTDRHGAFRVRMPRAAASMQLAVRFGGDASYAAQAPAPQVVDISRGTLDLQLSLERELDAAAAQQAIPVRTQQAGRPVSVQLFFYTESGKLLGRVQTSRQGRGTLRFPTARLRRPGPVTISGVFPGDAALNPLVRRYETVLVAPVELSLAAHQRQVSADGVVELAGRIRDPLGPVAGATVEIRAMGRHGASARSDAGGQFRARLRASDFPAGSLDLVARFTPQVVWRRAARSLPVEVEVLAPRPVPPELYLLPWVATLLALAVLAALRFWPLLLGLWRLAWGRRPKPRGEAEPDRPLRSGVRLARRTLRSMMSQALDINGEVWDAVETRLLPGARVTLQPIEPLDHVDQPGTVLSLTTDGQGRFASGPLAAGSHQVTVSVAGYVSERFGVQVPHRGTYHGVRVDLVPVRIRLLEIYKQAALPLLPDEGLWGCWTPRELMYHRGRLSGRRNPPLEQLTLLLEHAYWSPLAVDERHLERARALARQAG